jgi:hypothetical protein
MMMIVIASPASAGRGDPGDPDARPSSRAFCLAFLGRAAVSVKSGRADSNYHLENFKIINANTNEEYH